VAVRGAAITPFDVPLAESASDHDGPGHADQLGVGELDPGREVRTVLEVNRSSP